MSETTVSIIIPVYNAETYIRITIESCIFQTYQDIEIIIIDDGSTDSTPEIIRSLCFDKRIRYIRQNNMERSTARNRGLEESTGDFIQFLDADDIILPKKIEKQIKFLKNNQDYDFIYCKYEFINEENTIIKHDQYNYYDGYITSKILEGNFIPIHSMLSRRNKERFNSSRRLLEDWEYWIFATLHKKVGFLNEKLCNVRIHKGNSSSDKKIMVNEELSLYKKLIKDYRLAKYRKIILTGIIKRYIFLLTKIINKNYKNILIPESVL